MIGTREYGAVYACAKEAGLDEDARRDVFERLVGKRSLSLMSDPEVKRVTAYFKKMTPKKTGKGIAKRPDVRFIHVLWRQLGRAEMLDQPGRNGLNTFIRKRFGEAWGAETIDVDALTDPAQIAAVIEALKSWCDREGVEIER